ncbi:tail length tape-measure protein [Photobacterium phage PDCC-1]|uniref:Tail length tape-measure protein n=1 Tax=Photobacterium phage PDCC-1 TaxID=2664246 RepID=A0A6B9J292_9CAUD|nr:virion structural protein [Photobacterium phage PDCC-1]QGZ14400.1 tail length tape-measure protein [Photobacterium phage PDCC-1]
MSKTPNFVSMGTASGSGVKLSDGEQLIDLDEHYDDKTSHEETEAIAEYLRNGKLSKRALEQQKVSGTERFEPGCTELNGILGGESFLNSIKEGAKKFVAWAIKMISGALKWILVKAREFTNYFSDNREIQKSEEMLRDIEGKLMELGGPSFNVIDVKELTESHRPVVRRLEMVRLLKARNVKVLEAAKRLTENSFHIKKLISELSRHKASVNKTKDTFDKSVKHLRKRANEKSLTMEDLGLWEAQITDLVAQHLQTHTLKAAYVKLAAATTVDEKDQNIIDVDKQFREFSDMMKRTQEATKDNVSVEEFAQLSDFGNLLRKQISENPGEWDIEVDMSDLKDFDKLVSMSDLEFFETLAQETGNPRPVAVYREFVARCANYATTLQMCIEASVRYSNEARYLAEWSQRYDTILGIYSLETVKQRKDARQAHYDATGEQIDTANLRDVPEHALDPAERQWRALYDRLLPGMKKTMNTLSRKLNAGVTVK